MLNVVRVLFVLVAGIVGYMGSAAFSPEPESWKGALVGTGAAFSLVVLEVAFTRKFVGIISVLTFGVFVGFVSSYLFVQAFYLIPGMREMAPERRQLLEFGATIAFTFVSVITILHAKDDFKFVVPFVEFSRQGRFGASLLLDTSAIIDGRLLELFRSGVVEAPVVLPRFVISELHALSDSADKIRRARGRRGLDILDQLRKIRNLDMRIDEAAFPEVEGVDHKLVRLARQIGGKVVTADFNLEKVAQVQGVDVINLNSVANSMRPPVLQGDQIHVKILKPGDSPGQGVGYLEDGTMVVAEDCQKRQGDTVRLVVTNIIQSQVGRMVFAKPELQAPAAEQRAVRPK
jgi:uncharacterized protein YacL